MPETQQYRQRSVSGYDIDAATGRACRTESCCDHRIAVFAKIVCLLCRPAHAVHVLPRICVRKECLMTSSSLSAYSSTQSERFEFKSSPQQDGYNNQYVEMYVTSSTTEIFSFRHTVRLSSGSYTSSRVLVPWCFSTPSQYFNMFVSQLLRASCKPNINTELYVNNQWQWVGLI